MKNIGRNKKLLKNLSAPMFLLWTILLLIILFSSFPRYFYSDLKTKHFKIGGILRPDGFVIVEQTIFPGSLTLMNHWSGHVQISLMSEETNNILLIKRFKANFNWKGYDTTHKEIKGRGTKLEKLKVKYKIPHDNNQLNKNLIVKINGSVYHPYVASSSGRFTKYSNKTERIDDEVLVKIDGRPESTYTYLISKYIWHMWIFFLVFTLTTFYILFLCLQYL